MVGGPGAFFYLPSSSPTTPLSLPSPLITDFPFPTQPPKLSLHPFFSSFSITPGWNTQPQKGGLIFLSVSPLSLSSAAFPSLTDEFLPRTLDGVSLTTVAMVVLVLIVLDVVGTLILATAVSGRSRSSTFFPGDWDLSGAAGRIYNR